MTSVLIVCSGNICRSPMAEVVLNQLGCRAGLDLRVDSAGTGGWHVGEPMDRRAVDALAAAGYGATHHAARQVTPGWLAERDLVLAADRGHLLELQRLAPTSSDGAAISLLGAFSGVDPRPDIPDPYYGDTRDFAACLDLIEQCCKGVVASIVDSTTGR